VACPCINVDETRRNLGDVSIRRHAKPPGHTIPSQTILCHAMPCHATDEASPSTDMHHTYYLPPWGLSVCLKVPSVTRGPETALDSPYRHVDCCSYLEIDSNSAKESSSTQRPRPSGPVRMNHANLRLHPLNGRVAEGSQARLRGQ
jgi:hypothetical protein